MAKRRPQRSTPVPEVLGRGKFRVQQPTDKVGTDLQAGTMFVPLDDSDASSWVRRHEMARLTWSPDGAITDPYVQAFEEARLNLNLKRIGLDTTTGRDTATVQAHVARQLMGKPVDAALTRVALAGTSDEAEAARVLNAEPRIALAANEALTRLRRKPTWEGVQEAAQYMRERVKGASSAPKPQGGASRPGGSGDSGSGTPKLTLPPLPEPPKLEPSKPKHKGGATDDKDQEAADEWLRNAMKTYGIAPDSKVTINEFVPEEGKTPSPFSPPPSVGGVRWTRMVYVKPKLALRLPRKVGKGKWRPADSGAHPRRMERWASDMAVFSTRGKQRSGTVLIDGSGSMGLSSEAILQILLKAPAASIAMYSGEGASGSLWILASKGRRVATIPRRPGGNCVDGPALRWLARQKAPRLWVSDGMVTGHGDRFTQELEQESANICRVFGIKRIDNIVDAIRYMGGAKAEKQAARRYDGGGKL